MALQIRRGTDAERLQQIFAIAELVFTVDTQKLYVGDGTTPGGVGLSGIDKLADIGDVNVGDYTQTAVSLVSCTVSGVLTVTTLDAHNLSAGQYAKVQLDGNTFLNGTYEVTGTPDIYTVIFDGPLATVNETSDSGFVQRSGTNVPDQAILVYDSATDKWTGGSLDLNSLLDVDTSGGVLEDNDRLAYDVATSQWLVVSGDLASLTDVAITSATVNDILVHDGTNFVNVQHTVGQISDTDLRELQDQYGLEYDAGSNTWRPRPLIKAKVPGIKADLYLGNESNGLDTPVSTAKMYVAYPNTGAARWGSASAYFEGRSKLVWANSIELGTQNFTLQFWLKTNDQAYSGVAPSKQIISAIDTNEEYLNNFILTRRMIYGNYVPGDEPPQAAGAVTLWTRPDSGSNYIIGSGVAVIDDNQWHLVTIQRESTHVFAIFVDGVLQRRRTLVGEPIFFKNLGGWNIGARYFNDGSVNNANFKGYLDDVQLYVGSALYSGLDEFTVPWWPALGQTGYVGDSISRLGDVDTTSIAPSEGSTLVWDGYNWVPGSGSKIGRGDGGDFDTGYPSVGFVFGVHGAGDFDAGSTDAPWEELNIVVDAGDFD